ncbi:MAG: CPBP family glutamic-type intramembrane protease [Paludibacteraceae bacterium]|nr:CPBP family glutamic-type intramembrane protease [Paludibacteraceae bacterium]
MVKRLCFSFGVAFVLWTLMFSPWTAPFIPFWPAMTFSAVTLIALASFWGGPWWRQLHFRWSDLVLGIAIAVLLWGVFWLGDKVSQWLFPSFARQQVNSIYGMKQGFQPWLISLLLLFIIGPAEEIFWRGYIQRSLYLQFLHTDMPLFDSVSQAIRLSAPTFLAVGLYTLVHLFSFNFMLIMAALVCGIVWGGLYYLMPKRLPALIISHALWDAAVFVWFPI